MRILDPSGAKLGIEALGYEPDQKASADGRDRAPLRHGAGHRPDRLRQDGVALHLPEHPEPARHQHLDGRGSGRDQPARRQPGQRQRQGGPDVRGRAASRSCARIRTSSWSARSATSRPPTSRSRRRRPATWCCRRCTPTTRRPTLTRLMNMGVAPFNIASSVILITAQRLARRLCTCKQPRDIPRGRAAARRLHGGRPRRQLEAVSARSAASAATAPATRAASASTRSCRSPTTIAASSSCATATRCEIADQAKKEGVQAICASPACSRSSRG